jgi:hypothetical protein
LHGQTRAERGRDSQGTTAAEMIRKRTDLIVSVGLFDDRVVAIYSLRDMVPIGAAVLQEDPVTLVSSGGTQEVRFLRIRHGR